MRRIPRELLHLTFDELAGLGVPPRARDALRGLLADLPLVPEAGDSAQLVGPPEVAVPCLVVLTRHIVQGLRDHNLTLAHDRARLRAERRKLRFLDASALLELGDVDDCVLCLVDGSESIVSQLRWREQRGLATFVASEAGLAALADWRLVRLG